MKIHQLSVAEALSSLKSAVLGLTREEAARRSLEFGPNRIERVPRERWLRRLLGPFTHFFAAVLWAAAALAFFAESRDPGQGMATLGAAIVVVIVTNGAFSFWQEYRAERALAALGRLLPHRVTALRDGNLVALPTAALVPGDVVLLEGGDDVPADCRLIEAYGVQVSNATITGESVPLLRDAEPSSAEDPLRSRNLLLAGTSLVAGQARAVVFATGMRTEFGKIAHLTQVGGVELSPLQKEIGRLSRVIGAIASGLGILFFGVGQGLGLPFWSSMLFAIGILVANVPEGLLPTVTLALAMAGQRMVRRNVLIRHLPSVETLGCATVILSDKTGTLTQNRMDAKRLFLGDAFHDADTAAACAASHRRFFEAALHCHDLKPRSDGDSVRLAGDPTELALWSAAHRAWPDAALQRRIGEIPFDSERRRLSTLHETPTGRILYAKGALESLRPLCRALQIGDRLEPLSEARAQALGAAEEAMGEDGLRVLALAYREVPEGTAEDRLEQELVLTGLVGLRDPPRPEVPAAIAACRGAGIKVIVVTGDHPRTAVAIAREIDLVRSPSPLVLTGVQLRRLGDAELQLALDEPEIVFARVGADQKLRIVQMLKRKGEIVAATGDGVNDAPALKEADVGVAMGISGTDVAREASHMVLLDDNFASIVAGVEEGRAVYDNIRKFLTYILTSNVPEIVPYLAFVLFRIPLPLTIVQILAVDLGTDMLPALALGAERPEADVMRRPPRRPSERLLSGRLLLRAYGFLGLMEATAAMAAFFFVLDLAGWRYGELLGPQDPLYRQATTACLAAIIAMQVVNVFACRSARHSAFDAEALRNPLLWLGLAAEIGLLLAIAYTPAGNWLVGTAPIPAAVWLLLVPFASGMLLLEELRKWLVRRAFARKHGKLVGIGGRSPR